MFRKIKLAFRICPKLPLLILGIPVVLVIRLIRPWFLVRWGRLYSERIGHFTINTELYLCELDAGVNRPRQRHVDFFSIGLPICNQQLAKMWKRVLRVRLDRILTPVKQANRLIPGGAIHIISINSLGDRDVHNLIDHFPPHLRFTDKEEARGEAGLRMMGISADSRFVCLIVRDSAYLDAYSPRDWSYHNYRDSDIQNYVLAAEELAERGYFVIRMGAKVREKIKSSHPRVIDYASNGMRSDFMDVYLGAKCEFCISGVAGFDGVPFIFRRPITWVNFVPFGFLPTSGAQFMGITKHHFSLQMGRELTLREIFSNGAGLDMRSSDYESKEIQLIENTPEEIRDVVIEMSERLKGTWQPQKDDEALQQRFWEIFPTKLEMANGKPLHGEIRSHFGAAFLQNNEDWLQ